MCISPELFCCICLVESSGQLLRYPVEKVEDGLWLCSAHKQSYLRNEGLDLLAQHGFSTTDDSVVGTSPSVAKAGCRY